MSTDSHVFLTRHDEDTVLVARHLGIVCHTNVSKTGDYSTTVPGAPGNLGTSIPGEADLFSGMYTPLKASCIALDFARRYQSQVVFILTTPVAAQVDARAVQRTSTDVKKHYLVFVCR